ncbi:MAG: ABC transporter permease [Bacteroidota bacterium]
MLKNYVNVALRSMRRHLGYTSINVFGLTVGVAAFLVLVLFIRHSLSFDQFHEAADRTYRLVSSSTPTEGESSYDAHMPEPLAPALREAIPEIDTIVRLVAAADNVVSWEHEGQRRQGYEDHFIFADASFFEAFSFRLLAGDPGTALSRPYTVVLTEETARRYFGDDDPLGKVITLNNAHPLTVAGVLEDVPSNSSIEFDLLSSLATYGQMNEWFFTNGWNSTLPTTYLVLHEGASVDHVEARIPAALAQRTDAEFVLEMGYRLESYFQSRFQSQAANLLGPQFDARYLYVFTAVAFLILVIACINYMNLATARATRRAQEVGVRKAIGAQRYQLASQFLGESMLTSIVAVLGAIVLVGLTLPLFGRLVGQEIPIGILGTPVFWMIAILVALIVGVLAGVYPALLLSRFRPTAVLSGRPGGAGGGAGLRKGLVVFQFTISSVLVVSTLIVQSQLSYLQTKNLGLNAEQVIALPLRAGGVRSPIAEQTDAFKAEAEKIGTVQGVTFASTVPSQPTGRFAGPRTDNGEPFSYRSYQVGTGYLDLLGIEVAEGRGFLESRGDVGASVLVNEAALRALGWEAGAASLGRTLPVSSGEVETIVGIVRDFHFESLHTAIGPVVLRPLGDRAPNYAVLRADVADLPATLELLSATWRQFSPEHPFDYVFLDEAFADLYEAETRLADLFNAFTLIAILIACLGLFGLAAFTAEQRRKEVGVRKVLGATVSSLVGLLTKDFVLLVSIAYLVALPLAWVAMDRWLEGFAYHVPLGPLPFLVAGTLVTLIALGTVGTQALRAATADPIRALRSE